MHQYSQLEPLAAEPIRSRLAEAKEPRTAHALGPIPGQRTTRGEDGSNEKLRLPLPRLTATRRTCDTPAIRLQGRAS
jgi:hypothetical protein